MVYPDSIYMTYPCIFMVYVFMDIHVISLDIPSFLFSAGPCCWMHTFVGVSECFIARTTLAMVPGEKVVYKSVTSSSSCLLTPCLSPLRRGAS